MSIREALEKRIPRVRLHNWSKNTYLRLPLTEKGYGLWAELYDRESQEALKIPVGSQRLLMLGMFIDADGYEEYNGVWDVAEKENYSKNYSEK